MQKLLIIIGLMFIFAGILLPWLMKSQLGRLPGDIIMKHNNVTFYFPLATSLIISVTFSLLLWLFNR